RRGRERAREQDRLPEPRGRRRRDPALGGGEPVPRRRDREPRSPVARARGRGAAEVTARGEIERSALVSARRVVVKIGSRLLADNPASRPAAIADQVLELRRRGVEVVIVSSGAIALGMRRLRLAERPTELPAL